MAGLKLWCPAWKVLVWEGWDIQSQVAWGICMQIWERVVGAFVFRLGPGNPVATTRSGPFSAGPEHDKGSSGTTWNIGPFRRSFVWSPGFNGMFIGMLGGSMNTCRKDSEAMSPPTWYERLDVSRPLNQAFNSKRSFESFGIHLLLWPLPQFISAKVRIGHPSGVPWHSTTKGTK